MVKISKAAKQVKIAARREPESEPPYSGPFLSTGSTLLNLAISDRVDGGLIPGKYYFFVGDSSSGKTFLSMTNFAEAMASSFFRNYALYYDNIEDGMLMDVPRLFGSRVAERLRAPKRRKGEDVYSETIEDFYDNITDLLEKGDPFIYVLDSMDALLSEAENEKFDEQKEARAKGKEVKGSYGDGKAKKNSAGLRRVLTGLRETGSILIVICQTRDNIGGGPWASKKTRSGGRALRFYATTELWTAPTGAITKTIRGKKRKIGTGVKISIQKNRVTGKLHEVELAIYPSYGIDDIGSCIDFLCEEKWWTKPKKGKVIKTKELGSMSREKLIEACETKKGKRLLFSALQACWDEIQKDSELERKRRYA